MSSVIYYYYLLLLPLFQYVNILYSSNYFDRLYLVFTLIFASIFQIISAENMLAPF